MKRGFCERQTRPKQCAEVLFSLQAFHTRFGVFVPFPPLLLGQQLAGSQGGQFLVAIMIRHLACRLAERPR